MGYSLEKCGDNGNRTQKENFRKSEVLSPWEHGKVLSIRIIFLVGGIKFGSWVTNRLNDSKYMEMS
jgi:hypothetical protein